MVVIKRDGTEVPFDKSKIYDAVLRAMLEVDKVKPQSNIKAVTDSICNNLEGKYIALNRAVTVEEIQDDVETCLMEHGKFDVAKAYITYRYKHGELRKANSTDGKILSLVNGVNETVIQENSNKNPAILSTQRDYIAGEVSRDISNRLLLPEDVVKAHDEGIIHFHDADYYPQKMHNCFSSKTKFVTRSGIVSFAECVDGQKVIVLDKDGVWREATVRYYGKQKLYDVFLHSARSKATITCTRNHRWILKDGTVTTNLKPGDSLYVLKDTSINKKVVGNREAEMFALGFIIGDGVDHSGRIQARLCGRKVEYLDVFRRCNFTVSEVPDSNDLYVSKSCGISKQAFLDLCGWRYLSDNDKESLFCGLYAADGGVDRHQIATADKRVLALVQEISAIAGYHISSVKHSVRDTNYKKNASIYTVNFRTGQNEHNAWTVDSIRPHRDGDFEQSVWCVEEPVTHSFTLNGGIVTGNCCIVNLEDMLQNGTVINGTLVEKPHSFATACNVATQIMAQVASCQYGGQSESLAHLAPFVDISRKKIRSEIDYELNLANGTFDKDYGEVRDVIVERRVKEEIRRGVQTIQYQINTLMTTNGQAPFVTIFMYLGEAKDPRTKADLALVIEEVLNQRIQGVKNEKGIWITPAFPKIIYVLEEDNITEGAPYWYLTELAAKCTAKRMVPDYISEKKMLEYKGDVYTCINMTCA